jgi:serine/threonine protein kinase
MNNCPNCGKPYQTGDEVCRTCGFILPITSPIISAGEILQTRYEIQEMIHSGGMGYVYLATDKRLYDRLCIVKQVKEPIKSDAHRKKLEEEALRMSKLHHPNVTMILDHFIDNEYYFLVVERIYGKTLGEVYKERRGHLTENEVVRWAISICDVVSYLHSEGIVHRDISPDNIMLTGEGSIKFIDFGTLREFRYIAPGGTVGIGKYGYTPPEQWQGRPGPRSDIFALGATVYYLLTGFLPLSREYTTRQAPQKEDFNPSFPPVRTKNPDVSPQFEAVLQKALQLDVNGRYSSAAEFGEALRNLERVEVKKIPVLSLETSHLDFTNVKSGATVTKPLILRNTGSGKLSGKLTASQSWLKVSPSKIGLERGEWEGKVAVNTRRFPPGARVDGAINILTNGGNARVTVSLSTAAVAVPEAPMSKRRVITKRGWLQAGIALLSICVISVLAWAAPSFVPRMFHVLEPSELPSTAPVSPPEAKAAEYLVTVSSIPPQGGSVSPGGGTFPPGEVSFTAVPAPGYHFCRWSSPEEMKTPLLNPADILVFDNTDIIAQFLPIVFEDDFSNSRSLWKGIAEAGEYGPKIDEYSMSADRRDAATRVIAQGVQASDFFMDVDITSMVSDGACGITIVFWFQGWSTFHEVGIVPGTGTKWCGRAVGGGWENISISQAPFNYVPTPPNSLQIYCHDGYIEVYGNHQTLLLRGQIGYEEKGQIGLGVNTYGSNRAPGEVRFDNVKICNLE